MQVEWLPVADLSMRENNPRTHTDEQINQVVASIQEFGWTNPLLVDKDQAIVAGHCRYLAAQRLGLGHVPTIRLEKLTPAQIEAYVIADNKLAENAGWDMGILQTSIAGLKDLDFNLDLLGFNEKEMDRIARHIAPTRGLTDPDNVPDVPKIPVTTPGDLWILGHHRVLCGDATSPEAFKTLAGGGALLI